MTAELRQTAEDLAAGMIRRALDNATTPDLARIADQCALTPREVSDIRDRMLSGKRAHQTPRPAPAAAPAPGGAPCQTCGMPVYIARPRALECHTCDMFTNYRGRL